MALTLTTVHKPIQGVDTVEIPQELVDLLMQEVPKNLASNDYELALDAGSDGETKKYYLWSRAWAGRVNASRDDPTVETHPLAKADKNLLISKLPSRKGQADSTYRMKAEYVALDHVGAGRPKSNGTPAPDAIASLPPASAEVNVPADRASFKK